MSKNVFCKHAYLEHCSFNTQLHRLFYDLFERKSPEENYENLGKKMQFLNQTEIIIGNGAFACYELMLHFLQRFQKRWVTETKRILCGGTG